MTPKIKKILEEKYKYDFASDFWTDDLISLVNDVIKATKESMKRTKLPEISFEESDIFDKHKFAGYFKTWNKVKMKYYYESAESYSAQGHRYVDWGKAIRNWAAKDSLVGVLKFVDNTNIVSQGTVLNNKQ